MDAGQVPHGDPTDPTDPTQRADPAELAELASGLGPVDRLASVVAINASLIDRIVRRSGELTWQRDDGVLTERAYGGEMYRLAKAVRQANGLIVGRLAGHLPMPDAAVCQDFDARFDASATGEPNTRADRVLGRER